MRRFAALVGAAFTAAAVTGFAGPASGAPRDCTTTFTDYCVEDEISYPDTGGPAAPRGGAPEAPSPSAARPIRNGGPTPQCTWVRDPGSGASADGSPGAFPDIGARPARDAYLIFEQCDGELTGRVQWTTPSTPAPPDSAGAAAQVASPEQLAATIRVRLEGNLPQPVAATSPPADEPAVVNHPTFLAIDNWTEAVTDRECAFLLCVTVTATPTLTWSPGEPGAPTLACEGGGTRFDPDGPPPDQQAAAIGACAYAYRARTSAEDRPDRWPGVATVTWDLAWTSTSGAGGSLPSIERSVDVPRAVDEVQAVVVR